MASSSNFSHTEALSSIPLSVEEVAPIIQKYSLLMGKVKFDAAREHIEAFKGKRNFIPSDVESMAWLSILSVFAQFPQTERIYFSLNFLLPKAFFRKDNALLTSYSQIKSEVQHTVEDLMSVPHPPLSLDLCQRIIDIIDCRLILINNYIAFTSNKLCSQQEIGILIEGLNSVLKVIAPSRKHDCLSGMFELIASEVTIIKSLLEVQNLLLRCEFLPSLIKLKNSREHLRKWFTIVDYAKIRSKSTSSFFHFPSSSKASTFQLFEWIERFYSFLLSKFSLYFHEWLTPQCSHADVKQAIGLLKSPNFLHIFSNFHRKSDALFVSLVMSRIASKAVSSRVGYGQEASETSSGELREKYPLLYKSAADRKDFDLLHPTIASLIQSAANSSIQPERIKYFFDQVLLKTFFIVLVEENIFMVVVFSRKIGEKDSSIVCFINESVSTLRCSKICLSLRGASK
ncbi:hypothetical protein AB6A40_001281 [Gnathostoma spinigerum]|uniref:Uncharacterized protein n=1 Tax=Gnathostoma spinigerum TaxID=75299 RepID=A0ABD6EDJ7_9BILA